MLGLYWMCFDCQTNQLCNNVVFTDQIYLHDRSCISITDLRKLCFSQALLNKPRLYFIQACRGEEALRRKYQFCQPLEYISFEKIITIIVIIVLQALFLAQSELKEHVYRLYIEPCNAIYQHIWCYSSSTPGMIVSLLTGLHRRAESAVIFRMVHIHILYYKHWNEAALLPSCFQHLYWMSIRLGYGPKLLWN